MICRLSFAVLLAPLLACAPVLAEDEAEPEPPAPAEQVPADDAPVEDWLNAIEARAAELDTLRAQVAYLRVQQLLGDRQTRFGDLHYDAGPPARFHLHFDRIAVHDRIDEQNHRFIFDGRWLAERLDDRRQFILRELVPEDRVGEDLLRLGQGPFALPLDLERETVLQRFEVERVTEDSREGDAFAEEHDVPAVEDAIRLRLTPREGVEIDQSRIELWYDRELLLPVRAYTVNEEDATESIISMRRFETNFEVDEGIFSTEPPEEPGWQIERNPLQQ